MTEHHQEPEEQRSLGEVSPKIEELAKQYFTPEQLQQMAAKRAELTQRWQRPAPVGDLAVLPATPRTMIGSVKASAPAPLPIETTLRVCPTCHMPIRDDSYGWLRPANNGQDGSWRAGKPCPACSPRVKALKAAKKMRASLGDLFGGANIPDYAASWDFETYPKTADQEAKEEALAFANRETVQRGLYLWGRLGRGKTSLAISILKVFLAQEASALYIRAAQYLRLVNQAARGNEKQNPMLDLAYSVTCLVLDDLGTEQATPAAIRELYELIEERRGTNGLYTVITSNLSIDDLEERWRPNGIFPGEFHEGMRVTDRLRESWGELEIQGMSLRGKGV